MHKGFWWGLKKGFSEGAALLKVNRESSEGARVLWDLTADQFEAVVVAALWAHGFEVFRGARDLRGRYRFTAQDFGAPLGYQLRPVTCFHQPEVTAEDAAPYLAEVPFNQKPLLIASGFFAPDLSPVAAGARADLVDGDALAALMRRERGPRLFGV